jgi:uncharacterized damage-inducible protein DinB
VLERNGDKLRVDLEITNSYGGIMRIADTLLPEFDVEMAGTRRTLERVPDDKFDWAPHEKSAKLGDLASHLANLPSWVGLTLDADSLDLAPKDGEPPRTKRAADREELLRGFDESVAKARAALEAASDETLMGPWTLMRAGEPLFTQPRAAILRGFVFNHNVHHRAQLGVYLRLNDVPVPSIYGPSADESPF